MTHCLYDHILRENPAQLTVINHGLIASLQEKHVDVTAYLDGLSSVDRAKLYLNNQLLDLDSAHIQETHIEGSDLRYARFRNTHLHHAHIAGVNLIGADLTKAVNFADITAKKDYAGVVFSRSTQIPEKSPKWAVRLLKTAVESPEGYAQWQGDKPIAISKEEAETFREIPCYEKNMAAKKQSDKRRHEFIDPEDFLPSNKLSSAGQDWLERMRAGAHKKNDGIKL